MMETDKFARHCLRLCNPDDAQKSMGAFLFRFVGIYDVLLGVAGPEAKGWFW